MITPRTPQQPSRFEKLADLELVDQMQLSGNELCDMTIGGADARDVSIDESQLIRCELSSRQVYRFSVVDTIFEQCLLIGLNADGSLWRRIQLSSTQAAGIILSGAIIEDVTITNSQLAGANFRLSRLKRVLFKNCNMHGADFSLVQIMDHVQFDNCDLAEADFGRAKIVNVDLRGSCLNNINGFDGLAGAIISHSQLITLAPQLARHVGLVVKD